jgi:hypothetical protein
MEKKLYQMLDVDGEPAVLLSTNIDSEILQKKWEVFYHSDWECMDQFVGGLKAEGIEVDRIFLEEINC